MKTKRLPNKEELKGLQVIPGIGPSIARNLWDIGVRDVSDLKNKDPEKLYKASNKIAGTIQDRCLLYVFRCAVYFASVKKHSTKKLLWWNWRD